jgi:hypothetical protein
MIKEANKKYANVSIEALELFKELCEECQLKKRKLDSKGLVVKPIVSKEFNSRGQMDFIDIQSLSYNDYRYLGLHVWLQCEYFVQHEAYLLDKHNTLYHLHKNCVS